MYQLWRKASGMIKDRNSIFMATLTRKKKKHGHPELDSAIIRATSHDGSSVDYTNAQRVFMWVRTTPSHLITFLCMLTYRIERTRDWVVALKSLILLHGVLSTKAPGTRKIGRLPFDLSGFEDGYNIRESEQCNAFVQAYFVFSDLKSVTLSAELNDEMNLPITTVEEKDGMNMLLVRVQRWQDLLEALLQVKPNGGKMTRKVVVLEAMDCMVMEVFELYSKICDGIAKGLMKIYTNPVGKPQAAMALDILQKANKQGKDLSDYFNLCQKLGLLHANECPTIQSIPEEDFIELEKIISGKGVSPSRSCTAEHEKNDVKNHENDSTTNTKVNYKQTIRPQLETIITDKWEVFEEDITKAGSEERALVDPFAAVSNFPAVIHFNPFIDYESKPSQTVLNLL